MNQFDDTIHDIINSASECNKSANSALIAEALISTQKIIIQSEKIKSSITNKALAGGTGKLLLLCAELEKVNSLLLQIKHEYSL